MIELVENDNVGVIIAKDMSRIGRNYLEVGLYTEMLFPEHDVRFIAVNSGVDSANQQDNDFTPFLNIIKIKRRMLIGLSDRQRSTCTWRS